MKRCLLLIISLFVCIPAVSAAGVKGGKVYVIPIHGVIDLGLSAFTDRICGEITNRKDTALVIFDIDTFGGRVDAAVKICASIKNLGETDTSAFVSGDAWSAGALVALSCKTIVMSPGSSIGSAEPVAGPSGKQVTSEKVISAIRAKFRAAAEENGHSSELAEAMVDKDIELMLVIGEGGAEILTSGELEEKGAGYKNSLESCRVLSAKGKLLNLTAEEAKELGIAAAICDTCFETAEYKGIKHPQIVKAVPLWSEVLVRFITHPVVSSLLLTMGFLGLIFELRIPGWGIAGTAGIISLSLFFGGHLLAGLAGWIEILLFIAGILLILAEIFIVPGFGITGVSGIILTTAGTFLALIKHPLKAPHYELMGAFYIMAYAFIFTVIIAFLSMRFLPETGIWKRLVLAKKETAEDGYSQDISLGRFLNKKGVSVTNLRPAGKAEIGGDVIDVVTEGEFVPAGASVTVFSVEGTKVVVRKG